MASSNASRPGTGLPLLLRPKKPLSQVLSARETVSGPSSPRLLSPETSLLLQDKLSLVQSYRDLRKVLAKNSYKQRANKPVIEYLATLDRAGSSPKASSVLKPSPRGQEVQASHYFLGKDCAHALARSLNRVFEVEKVHLRGNKLAPESSRRILKRLHLKQTRELDLTDNRVDAAGVGELCDLVQSEHCCLQLLHLESCGLSSSQVEDLCQALSTNSTLQELNLARNKLGEVAAKHIGEMLRRNSALKRLDLHWNNLRFPGALQLFQGFQANDDLVEIDLSWNSLNQGDSKVIAAAFGSWLSSDTHVRHLDLSFNYLSAPICDSIGTALCENHVLIGLHVTGNYCEMDAKGFVKGGERCEKTQNALILPRILQKKWTEGTRCWICEKWVEFTLTIDDPSIPTPCFVHFEFDGFKPELLTQEGLKRTLTVAVPSDRPRFFLSTLDGPIQGLNYDSELFQKAVQVTYFPGRTATISLSQLYSIKADGPVYTANGDLGAKPRTLRAAYSPPVIEEAKIPWTLPISLFASYRFTTAEMVNDCFEFDWKSSKIQKLVKDPNALAACKERLRKAYGHIREAYKYFAAIDSGGSVFSIGQNVFTDIANKCGLTDENYGLSDLDLVLTSTNYTEVKNNPLNPSTSMVRYKFLEVLVRIAFDKYVRRRKAANIVEALDRILALVLPVYSEYNTEDWRWGQYLCEEVDLTLKHYKSILDYIYNRFCGRKAKPHQKPFMSKEEWSELCSYSGLINDFFPARETDLVFNLAMSVRVDELTESKHMEMTFVEFLEALARACDKASMPPADVPAGTWSPEALQRQALSVKIRNAVPALLKLCPKSMHDAVMGEK